MLARYDSVTPWDDPSDPPLGSPDLLGRALSAFACLVLEQRQGSLKDGARESRQMPKAYFESENIRALAEVLAEAKHRLNLRDVNDSERLDFIAARMLNLAADVTVIRSSWSSGCQIYC